MSSARSQLKIVLGCARDFVMMLTHPRQREFYGTRFVNSSEGVSQTLAYERFKSLVTSAGLLQSLPDPAALLGDRAVLSEGPPGTLGRKLLEFMDSNGLTVGFITNLVDEFDRGRGEDPQRAWFRRRTAVAHDLRHVLSGYGVCRCGEICNLFFRLGQTEHRGVAVLAVFGALLELASGNFKVISQVLEAYRRGRRSMPIDDFPWELYLGVPLAQCRAVLGLTPPKHFPAHVAPDAYLPDAMIGEGVRDPAPVAAAA